MHAPIDAPGPVDRLFARLEADVINLASLIPSGRAVLHRLVEALALRVKESRARLAGELREVFQSEVAAVAAEVDPVRRERVRAYLLRRIELRGLEQRPVSPKHEGDVVR